MNKKRNKVILKDVLGPKGYIRGPFGSALKRGELLGEGIPVYEQQHAISDSRTFRFYIDDKKFESMKRFQVQENDLIISCSGTVGCVSIIGPDDPKGIISQALLILRANTDVVLPQYLKYFFTSKKGYNAIVSRSSGSVQVNIAKREIIEQIELDLPDIPTQQKIVGVLEALDQKISNNNAINDNLQQQAQALFESWFVDYTPWNGERPTSWVCATLGDFVEIKRGGSPRPIQDYLSGTGLRWLKISDVTSLSSPFVADIKEHIKEAGLRKTVLLKSGSLVLSNSATPGIPKILDVDSCIHDGWLYFPKSQFSKYYLYLFFKYVRKQLVALGNGSVFTNLKTDILRQFPSVMPDASVLADFDAIITPLFEGMLNADRENRRLTTIRDTLLPRLMSGEIDASDIQI